MSPDAAMAQLLIDAVLAVGIGLFIGLEREHSDIAGHAPASGERHEPGAALLGMRTFALLALFGWISAYSASVHPWLPVAALVVVGALVFLAAARGKESGRGLTTEVAALVTLVLGMMVQHQRLVAVALALVTTLLLISKPWFSAVVPRMSRVDLTSTLQLLIFLAIVLPLLPTEASDRWGVLSPRRVGMFGGLIGGIGYVGYVLNRLLGSRRGAGLTGLVGGLVSSTAVTVAMAQQARNVRGMAGPGQLATLLACTVMLARIIAIAAFISAEVAAALLLPIAAMIGCCAAGAYWRFRAVESDEQRDSPGELRLQNPFSLVPALSWGLLLAATLVVSAMARETFGNSGYLVTAAISGLVDVDAITLAATRSVAHDELEMHIAVLALTLAIASNTVVKALIAYVTGGRAYGRPVALVLGASMVVGLIVAALSRFL